ncbi:MAG: hypothetical protein J6F30_10740 [Cellulosilyticum sp.]|nr:hypothetical protein [Cellulosilyticum sp.]
MFISTLSYSLLLIGLIIFLVSKKSYISFPVPDVERLNTASIQLITEAERTKLTH